MQGEEIRDGWLFYFRARTGWELSCWAPGRWFGDSVFDAMESLEPSVFFSPDIEIDEGSEDESFPVPTENEESYPGWWSSEYAGRVAEWAISKATEQIAALPK